MKTMRWFRLYSETLDDEKVQQLPAPLFRYWVNLLCLANAGTNRGRLPDQRAIAYRLRISLFKCEQVLAALIERALLDRDGDALVPHNWDERQPMSDNAAERMRQTRRTRSEQPPEKYSLEPEEDKEKNRTEPEEAAAATSPVLAALSTGYENNIGALNPGMAEVLAEWAERIPDSELGHAAIAFAYRQAVEKNARRWAYVVVILERLEAEGWPAEPGGEREAEASGEWWSEHKELHHRYNMAGKACPACGGTEPLAEMAERGA